YIFISLLAFFGIMSIGHFSYKKLFSKIGDGIKMIFNWIKRFFIKIKNVLQENTQFDSKNKTQKETKKDKPNTSEPIPEKEKSEEKKNKKRTTPVPIEGMKQTSLPIGDVTHLDNEADEETNIEDSEAAKDDNEKLEINFVSDEENEDYKLPPFSLLDHHASPDQSNNYYIIEQNIKKLEETFESFGVEATVVKANLGPAVTKYEIQPATGVKVSRIVGLSDDIALALAAKDIRMEAPIPGKALIGIEVPNSEINIVYYNEVMSELNQTGKGHPLEVPLGKDIAGNTAIADLSKMPHLLVAGATGSGKSVAINVIISSLLMRTRPHEVKMMLIDPKMVELNTY